MASNKRQQLLTFYEQEIKLNKETMANETTLKTLFQDWAEIIAVDELSDLNGVQVIENGWTHTAHTNWLCRIANDMQCYVNEFQPDFSIRKKLFKVIGFLPEGQQNRYMTVKLSLIDDGTGSN